MLFRSITGTAVKISSVKISLIDGNASIEGMEISNPNGFGNTPAFAFDKIYGSVNLDSIFSNQIIINKINIDSPMVSVIVDTNGINLNVIKDNIQNYLNSSSNTTSANTSSKSSKSVVVKSLDISNAKLFVGAFGEGSSINIPKITAQNIGQKTQTNLGDVFAQIISMITNSSLQEYLNSNLSKIAKPASNAVDSGLQKLENMF